MRFFFWFVFIKSCLIFSCWCFGSVFWRTARLARSCNATTTISNVVYPRSVFCELSSPNATDCLLKRLTAVCRRRQRRRRRRRRRQWSQRKRWRRQRIKQTKINRQTRDKVFVLFWFSYFICFRIFFFFFLFVLPLFCYLV